LHYNTTMDITINTPALLFPAISLIMLAYTNRFLALANVIRQLHERYQHKDEKTKALLHAQIKNLKYRLRLIKNMQIMGVLAFVSCILCMFFIYNQWQLWASVSFAMALVLFCVSLALSLFELISSTKSLEIELSDMQDIDESIVDNLKRMIRE
jgi:uncharacterized Tic20 family protein